MIYIDVNAVEDFRLSEEARAWWQMSATQQKAATGAAMRNKVDYATVTALRKSRRCGWRGRGFAARDDAQMAEFRRFIAREASALLAGGIRRAACVSR